MIAFENIIDKIMQYAVWPFIGFVFACAIVLFIYGIIEFILGADNEVKRLTGKKHIVWGTIGLVIMFAVWGIVIVIQNFIQSL